MNIASRLALSYLVMAVFGLALVAPMTPPFQNPDEPNHLLRADQVSHGGLLPRHLPDGEQGGWANAGVARAAAPFAVLKFNPDAKATRLLYAPQPWGELVPIGFPNTALYAPTLYVPQAAALFVARHWNLTILQGLTLARLTGGITAILLGTAAIYVCEGAGIWLYALLLLPMSVALTAAAAQDGQILACTALAAALARRSGRQPDRTGFAVAVLLLAVVACARLPYAAFAPVLMLARLPLRQRILGIAAVLAAACAWTAIAAPHAVLPIVPQGVVDPTAQLLRLLRAPQHIPALIFDTWQAHYLEYRHEFIGELGWLDTILPFYFYALAWKMLACAGLVAIACSRWARPSANTAFAALGILASISGVVLIEYMSWTVSGAPTVEGLQGRYFLPPALMLVTLLPPVERDSVWLRPFQAAIMLFPAFSIAVTVHTLLLRYYI